MDDPYRTAHIREQAQKLHEENQYAIMGTPWLMFPFERAIGLQGMEQFLLNMATEQDFAQDLLNRINRLCMINMETFFGSMW